MLVLGIYGSPRKGGNTDQLLDRALDSAEQMGAEISRVYVRDMDISGCLACGGCDNTGKCVIKDDMELIYPLLDNADIIFLASPIYFYSVSGQVKLLIDRSQAMWSKRVLQKDVLSRKVFNGGNGYMIAVGATRGKNLFEGTQLTAKYFFEALDMSYEGGIFFRRMDKKNAVLENPEALQGAESLGRKAVSLLIS
jgi:multimeric flavodoxin WrbA